MTPWLHIKLVGGSALASRTTMFDDVGWPVAILTARSETRTEAGKWNALEDALRRTVRSVVWWQK